MTRLRPTPDWNNTLWSGLSSERFMDWGWQVQNRVVDFEGLSKAIETSEQERQGLSDTKKLFRFAVCPYYLLLADPKDPSCPIRRQIIPSSKESQLHPEDRADPLGEESLEIVPNLVHRYPDRVLLLATDRCPVYCRFCTRRRIVGRIERQATRSILSEALDYIKSTPAIREVLISGGDALMNGDNQLSYLMKEIRAAPHVDIIRIATRMPVTCPMRVTKDLAKILGRYGPTYVMTHFNHPQECTELAAQAVDTLLREGVQVLNQSVLLRGINDSASTIEELNRLLVYMRVVPYYLHQCDLAEGIHHFRTPLQTGLDIIDSLRGRVSGLTVPRLCIDVPGGLGKVTVQPDWIVERRAKETLFRTYDGRIGVYPEPDQS